MQRSAYLKAAAVAGPALTVSTVREI